MKLRADQLACERGLCPSRAVAQRLIRDGRIRLIDGTPLRKPSQLIDGGTPLQLTAPEQYVSRGAYKLLAALDAFDPPVTGRVVLDLGASTGGFTDLLLQRGAVRSYAVDVGTGQLHGKLRDDPRVVNLEQTNAKQLDRALIPEAIGILVADVSFISLTKVLPPCAPLLADDAWIMVLVKPQFEAGRDAIGSGGVVRDQEIQRKCVEDIIAFARNELGWRCIGTVPSPIKGQNGNQEYIAAFTP